LRLARRTYKIYQGADALMGGLNDQTAPSLPPAGLKVAAAAAAAETGMARILLGDFQKDV